MRGKFTGCISLCDKFVDRLNAKDRGYKPAGRAGDGEGKNR